MRPEEAIAILRTLQGDYLGGYTSEALDIAIKALKTDIDIQDAYEQGYACGWKERFGEPQRPRGEWVLDQEFSFVFNMYECSKCRFNGSKRWKFCPNCGASMSANDEQVTGKLKQNFPFRLDCPCDDCKKMCIKCVDSCKKFRKWKEGEEE